jgi:hypothetical protein
MKSSGNPGILLIFLILYSKGNVKGFACYRRRPSEIKGRA